MGRGVRARAAGWTGGALLALAGCVVAPAEDADCEGGTAYSEAGNAMCVYRGGIQETGFECPDAMPHRGDFDDFTVCSERPVDRPMADRAWCASGHCEAPRELPDGGAPGGGSPDSGVPTAAIPPLPEDFDPGNAWATKGLVVRQPLYRRPPSARCGPGVGRPSSMNAVGRGFDIWNPGDSPVTLTGVRVEPPGRFAILNDVGQPPPTPLTLAPGAGEGDTMFMVFQACGTDGPDVAHAVFETDDPDRPEVRVPIVVANEGPCVMLNELWAVGPDTVRVRVDACGAESRITVLELDEADGFEIVPGLSLPAMSWPEFGGIEIDVRHAVDLPRPYPGALVVTTNDPLTPVLRIPLDWAR